MPITIIIKNNLNKKPWKKSATCKLKELTKKIVKVILKRLKSITTKEDIKTHFIFCLTETPIVETIALKIKENSNIPVHKKTMAIG